MADVGVADAMVFDDTFARDLAGLYRPWRPTPVASPRLLALNTALAEELGFDPGVLESPAGLAMLSGNAVPETANPIAQAYSGHQFGGFSPVLGDGRALLLGEVIDTEGRRRDLHLKGSGPTPFARRGDGRAAIGPMLREFVIGEAMHALGIPTTRALAVVATGEPVLRGATLPGAVLTRVAASHLRVGTFQYAATTRDRALLERLTRYALARHYPAAGEQAGESASAMALALLREVIDAQARLVAEWMLVGFVHGVMNTDNTTISGETIDYGPCAFIDGHDPTAVFSSIDHGGRYAYGNQPAIMQWNLARFAESLLPLLDDDSDRAVAAATAELETYGDRFRTAWSVRLRDKLGFTDAGAHAAREGSTLGDELIAVMATERLDHTATFRSLAELLRGVAEAPEPLRDWTARWRTAVLAGGADGPVGADRSGGPGSRRAEAVAARLDARNPIYIPRNQRVEEALEAASAGELGLFEQLVDVVSHPYEERSGLEHYAVPASARFAATFQTYCGT